MSQNTPQRGFRRVTFREIAAKAGVHFTTVSLALRNNPRLLPETRKKIQQIAEELGYKPDPMLASLNAYRLANTSPHYQSAIAWINNWPEREDLCRFSEFREYYMGACARAKELGYTVEEFWLHEPGMSPAKLYRILKARGIQGVLIPPQPMPDMAAPIDFTDYSVVTFGYSMRPVNVHVVTNHHSHSMALMMAHLNELGYRRIGIYATWGWDDKVDNALLSGMLIAQRRYPHMTLISPLLDADVEFNLGDVVTKHRLEVIISYSAILGELRRLKWSVPQNVGFASLNVGIDDKETSGVYENDTLIGKKAVDILVGMIHRGERGLPDVPVNTLVEGSWRPGKTLRQLAPQR